MLRPNVRIPLWAAVGVPAAAYVWRSAGRGWNFSLDQTDLLLGVLLLILVGLAAIARRVDRSPRSERGEDDLTAEMNDEDRQS
jgi:hypothetical protein